MLDGLNAIDTMIAHQNKQADAYNNNDVTVDALSFNTLGQDANVGIRGNEERVKAIIIDKIELIEDGGWHDQYHRPIKTSATMEDADKLDLLLNSGADITPGSVANKLTGVMDINNVISADSLSSIVDGWKAPRLRFIIFVTKYTEVGAKKYMLQGYSNKYNKDMTPDEIKDIPLHVNNVTDVAFQMVNNEINNADIHDNYRVHRDDTPNVLGDMMMGDSNKYLNRPVDLLSSMVAEGFLESTTNNLQANNINVRSSGISASMLNNTAVKSDARLENPNTVLAEVLNGIKSAKANSNEGINAIFGNPNDVNDGTSKQIIMDAYDGIVANEETRSFKMNPFFNELCKTSNDQTPTIFTLNDVCMIDATADSKITLLKYDEDSLTILSDMISPEGEHMAGADKETKIAIQLSEIISGQLIDCKLSSISGSFSNSRDGILTSGNPNGLFITGKYFSPLIPNDRNTIQHIENFKNTFLGFIAPVITQNGLLRVDLEFSAMYNGIFTIKVSVNGNAPKSFDIPTIASNKFSSMLSNGVEHRKTYDDVKSLALLAAKM